MLINIAFIVIIPVILICPKTNADEIYISPFIYDVQNQINTVIRIKGLASTVDMLNLTTCNIMDLDSRIIMNTNLILNTSYTVLARFTTPTSLGAFKIQCSKFGSIMNFDGNFLLVNSLHLQLSNVEPSIIKLGESVAFKMEIYNLSEPVPLICHLTDGEDYIILPTNTISGNKLSTWITCPEYKLNRAAEYQITIVYSTEAIDAMLSSNNFKVVTVQADRPKVIKSGFTKDLRTIWFQFDQNIEGPDSCIDIFTSMTSSQIGYDAICWFSSDHLTVLLGNIKTIKDNKFTIQFSSDNNIRARKSWPKLSSPMLNTEIVVPVIPSEVTVPTYWLHGPRQFCNVDAGDILGTPSPDQPVNDCLGTQIIGVSTIGSLVLRYSPILSFSDLSNTAHMSVDESANHASSVRNSMRGLVIMINRQNFTTSVCLNSAWMLPYVEYNLEISGTNILNQSGLKSQLTFKLIETHGIVSQPKLQIMARPTFAIGSEAIFETVLYPICGDPLEDNYDNLQYSWYFITENYKYNIIGVNGPVLILDTKGFSRGKNYTIGCELYNEVVDSDKKALAMAKDEIQFGIESFNAKTIIVPQQIVVAFGRSIHLKTKHQNYVTMGDVQYKWLCKTTNGDDCLMTGNYPELRDTMDEKSMSTSSELEIRELTLQPGRYYFVVQISLSGVPIDSAVSVVVVSFEPGPHITLFWPDVNFNPSIPQPPGSSFIMAATVSYLTAGCLTTWTTSSDSGYSYLTSKQLGGRDKIVREFMPGRNETFSRDIHLAVTLPNKVEQNTDFLLKLSVHCTSLKHFMFGIVPVSVIAPPRMSKLEVTPTEGIGLLTKFKFFTNTAYDTKSNHPIRYSFGFHVPTLTSAPIYFYSSTFRLQTESILPSVNSDVSKIKTILRVCNVYESCSTTEGPEISVGRPELSGADITYFIRKYRRMLVNQMLTESETYLITFMSTLKNLNSEVYEKSSRELLNVISTHTNDIMESVAYGKEFIPIGLALLDSISRTLFVLPKTDRLIISQSLVSLRDRIYSRLIAFDSTQSSSNNIRYIFKNVNSDKQNIYSQTEMSTEVVKLFLQVSETVISNQEDGPDGLNEKKKLLGSIENYAKHVCFTLDERQEIYVGSLVGSFSVQQVNGVNAIESSIDIPTCNSNFHKKCIKQKSKIMINKNLFVSHRTEFPLCFMSFHFYDDFFTQVFGSKRQYLKRHSGLYGFQIMKMSYKGRSNYESVVSNPSNLVNVIEIPLLQSSADNILECRYWNGVMGWTGDGCRLLGITTKSSSKFATCECPAFKYYGIFSVDVTDIPLDSSASDSTHDTVVYDGSKNRVNHTNNNSVSQRSLSDVYVAFKVNGDPADLHDQNIRDLENSLARQLMEKFKSLSSVMRELKLVMSEPMYVTMHLIQNINITTDDTVQELVKKLAEGSLILYDLHRYRLYVPEQPLRIMQPRNSEFNVVGKNIALFFAICVAFLACFVFGSILLKRHQLLTDISDVQQNLKKEDDSSRRPRYKKLESTELIEQNTNSEQRFRHLKNNVELSDSGITLHSDRTQINLLQQLR